MEEVDHEKSKLLVLANNKQHFQVLVKLLKTFFPSTIHNTVLIKTKYYTAEVQVEHQLWPTLNDLKASVSSDKGQIQEEAVQSSGVYDLLIFLASPEECYSAQVYDLLISHFNPDNFLLVLNTPTPSIPWKDETVIANEVNNFIEVIKEDLQLLSQNPPQRESKGLLTDSYDDGSFFSLIELMETTQWSTMKRLTPQRTQPVGNTMDLGEVLITKQQKLQGIKQEKENQQKKDQASSQQEQSHEQSKPELKPQTNPQVVPQEHELTQQQLERQMSNFQSIMQGMINMKEMPKSSNQQQHVHRKQKAERLISQLLGNPFI